MVVAALGIVICYADRSNMSTAILPMAEAFHWDKVRAARGCLLACVCVRVYVCAVRCGAVYACMRVQARTCAAAGVQQKQRH